MQRLIPSGKAARPVDFSDAPEPAPDPGEALSKVEASAPNRGASDRGEAVLPTGGAR